MNPIPQFACERPARARRTFAIGALVTLNSLFIADVCEAQNAATPASESPDHVTKAVHKISIADGALQLTVPADWAVREPRSRIISHEFAIPSAEVGAPAVLGKTSEMEGRLTIMAAGGSVQDNIDRWIGQFLQPDGSSAKDKGKVTTKEIAGQKVSVVDLSGTYQDRPGGPFGPAVERQDYRMLAAIIETKTTGNHFIKLYGPSKTIAGAEKQFHEFVESLQASK